MRFLDFEAFFLGEGGGGGGRGGNSLGICHLNTVLKNHFVLTLLRDLLPFP